MKIVKLMMLQTLQNPGNFGILFKYYIRTIAAIKSCKIHCILISCPPTWDGWQCWENGGRPGYTEYIECPKYIYFKTSSIESNGACGGNFYESSEICKIFDYIK